MASASSPPDIQGWQVGKSLSECFLYLFEKQVDCDVNFRILGRDGSTQTVSAHRSILIARSPHFEAMLKGCFNKREMNICDVEVEPFREMLRYVYSEEASLTGENVMHVLYAAKKYNIQGLLHKCQDYIEKDLAIENVAGILTSAVLYEDGELVKRCIQYIAKYTTDVVKTESFYNMSQDALLKLLECDYLPDGVEEEIYVGCVEWAKRQIKEDCTDEKVRAALGKCVYQIRFNRMSYDRFAEVVGNRNILTAEEKSAMLCLIVTKNEMHKDILIKLGFNLDSRMLRVNRYGRTNSVSFQVHNRTFESFEFSVQQPISIIGIAVYGSIKGAKHEISVTIEDLSKTKEVCSITEEVTSDGSGCPNPVIVNKTKVTPNTQYKVTVSVVGQEPVAHGARPLSALIVEDVTFKVQAHVWPVRNMLKGYIAEILFTRSHHLGSGKKECI